MRLEWNRNSARSSAGGHLICGVRTNVERYRHPFTKEEVSQFSASERLVGRPMPTSILRLAGSGRADNLKEYRDSLVQIILKAWKDLAPLVDEAVGHPRS